MHTSMSLSPRKGRLIPTLLTVEFVFCLVISGSTLVITMGTLQTNTAFHRADDLIANYTAKVPTPIVHDMNPSIVATGNRKTFLLVPKTGTALAPRAVDDPAAGQGDMVLDAAAVWGTYQIRNRAAVWGTSVVLRGAAAFCRPGSNLKHNG